MKILGTADFHGLFTGDADTALALLKNTEPVDVVVVAGDVFPTYEKGVMRQEADLVERFLPWCRSLDASVVFTLGNHDYLAPDRIRELIRKAKLDGVVHLLINETIEIDGVSFYGSPWSTPFLDWNWNAEEYEISKHCENLPVNTDVFITHAPPFGYCDKIINPCADSKGHLGSLAILSAILDKRPTWTLCGHIHTGSHSPAIIVDGSHVVNVSLRDEKYQIKFPPFIFEIIKN